ncbi:MAG: hypothetical protein U5R30_14170 [Deltaproteobacteria bacterium]|jgi:ElaB/YqjD/DUF883 family membrane-anchored ribosome-binding protein|nr:hypothetical protein [Deltaproteobacteria bacterium]
MDTDKNKHETPKQQTAGEPGSAGATAQKIVERGAEAYGQAEEVARDVYDKATHKISATYTKAKDYSNENPGKAMIIALGIGVGLGLLLGASTRRSRSGRYARPVVSALSDIALELFR